MRLRAGASGHVRRTPLRMLTTWASLSALSIRRTSTLAAAVTPYAAPRSRVDGGLFIHPKVIDHASLIEIISRSEKVA